MQLTSRRQFLKSSALAAGSSALAAPYIVGQDRGRDAKFRTAVVGAGWWGRNILGEAMASGQTKIVGLCDVDSRHLDDAVKDVADKTGDQPKTYRDFREMLAEQKPEIVIVATPDHWHPLATIAAIESGAHVYVEKPVGHTIMEGRAMVNAARAADRRVQVGTHRRVSPHNISGMEFLRSGKAGDIGLVNCFIRYGGGREEPQPNAEPSAELDWDMWCGPAPLRPFNERIHPKGFRMFSDYANWTIGDWGIHWFDQVLWWTEEKAPRKIFSHGGRPIKGPVVHTEQAQTTDAPDHQVATFEFDGFTCTWDNRTFAGNPSTKHEEVGAIFYGTKGAFHMGWKGGWTFYPINPNDPPVHEEPTLHEPDQQNIRELWADFLDAIRTGRNPVCDIEIGHRSTNMSLLANMSLKLGRAIEWDADTEKVPDDPEANSLLRREYRGEWKYPA